MIRSLINHIHTTPTFMEEGTKIPMRDALVQLIQTSDENQALYHQPIVAYYRLLRFGRLVCEWNSDSVNIEHIKRLIQRRFSYYMIETYASRIKPHGESSIEHLTRLDQYLEQVYSLLFDTTCGIPQRNSDVHLIDVNTIATLHLSNYDTVVQSIGQVMSKYQLELSDVINSDFMTMLLFGVSNIREYEKPLVMFTNALKRNKYIQRLEHEQVDQIPISDLIRTDMFRHKRVENIVTPAYAFYNGEYSAPSKLFFNDQLLFDVDEITVPIRVMDFVELLQERLDMKLVETYGSAVPNNRSAHIKMHKIVAHVIETQFKDVGFVALGNTVSPQLYDIMLSCVREIKRTRGHEGNIFSKSTLENMVYCILNFSDGCIYSRESRCYYETVGGLAYSCCTDYFLYYIFFIYYELDY